MTSREKGMLILMLVGGLGAGGYTAYDNYTSMLTASLPGKPAEQTLQEVRATLDAAKMDEGRLQASVAASQPITKEVFLAMPKWLEDLSKAKDGKSRDDLQYTGYLAAGKKLAIIGGTEYAVGDLVEGTNFTVKAVEPNRVLLLASDGEETELPYQGEDLLF